MLVVVEGEDFLEVVDLEDLEEVVREDLDPELLEHTLPEEVVEGEINLLDLIHQVVMVVQE